MTKDQFSKQADLYARFRPTYPPVLFDYILSYVNEKKIAWDCATGNGQAAVELANHFKKVFATDISAAQIEKATRKENIEYLLCPAESTPFTENTFDLVTVAQAYHWLQWDKFREEAFRVCIPGAVIAVWVYYDHTTGDEKVDAAVKDFYKNITGPYWDYERKYVEEKYASVAFDFALLPDRSFETVLKWKRDDLLGYISSWSAVQKFIKEKGHSPIPEFEKNIKKLWGENDMKKVTFPIYLKLGRVMK